MFPLFWISDNLQVFLVHQVILTVTANNLWNEWHENRAKSSSAGKNYSRNLWIHIPLFYWCWIHINHHSIHWPPKCTTYTHKLHRITADLDLFCNQLSWVFAIFGCGYLRETKTFTLHLTTKTTPIIPNLAPKLCKFQGKGPGTPIERGIFDASQIATHLVDDAIATPKDGWMDPTTNTGRTNGMFFFSRDAADKKQRIIHDYPDCCKMST